MLLNDNNIAKLLENDSNNRLCFFAATNKGNLKLMTLKRTLDQEYTEIFVDNSNMAKVHKILKNFQTDIVEVFSDYLTKYPTASVLFSQTNNNSTYINYDILSNTINVGLSNPFQSLKEDLENELRNQSPNLKFNSNNIYENRIIRDKYTADKIISVKYNADEEYASVVILDKLYNLANLKKYFNIYNTKALCEELIKEFMLKHKIDSFGYEKDYEYVSSQENKLFLNVNRSLEYTHSLLYLKAIKDYTNLLKTYLEESDTITVYSSLNQASIKKYSRHTDITLIPNYLLLSNIIEVLSSKYEVKVEKEVLNNRPISVLMLNNKIVSSELNYQVANILTEILKKKALEENYRRSLVNNQMKMEEYI